MFAVINLYSSKFNTHSKSSSLVGNSDVIKTNLKFLLMQFFLELLLLCRCKFCFNIMFIR